MKPVIILDSGAYSAWRMKTPIDIDKYCDFLLENAYWLDYYVNLDVIAPQDPDFAAAESFKNFLHMRKRGLNPIPVFHVRETFDWLYRILDTGCDYIGLSASSLVGRGGVNDWYAKAWSQLVTADGLPVVKAHAFGEGRYNSLVYFPWYSADTASWIYQGQRAANIRVGDSRNVNVRKNLATSAKNNPHVDILEPLDKIALDRLCEKAGIIPSDLKKGGRVGYQLTTLLTLMYYKEIEDRVNARTPIKAAPSGLIQKAFYRDCPPVSIPKFNFHFVVGGNVSAITAVVWLKIENVLISYYDLSERRPGLVELVRDTVIEPEEAVIKHQFLYNYWKILQDHVRRENACLATT